MAEIRLEGVSKSYGDHQAVDGVSLSVRDGELLCLLGPSGCGKSTTMRIMSGLEAPSAGSVYIGGEDVAHQPSYERDTSMVFQNWALFPHKTVLENVTFGLKMRGDGAEARSDRAREMLERVHMSSYESSTPGELSGGQKQRIALARSLAVDPNVLLLDEPLSNLDKRLREEMEIELKEIQDEFQKTFVHVTHNQDEAFTLADRIGIMNDGRLVQVGEPTEVYRDPTNRFVEEFLGDTNFLTGEISQLDGDYGHLTTDAGTSLRVPAAGPVETGRSLTVSLRPEFMQIRGRQAATESAPARTDGTGDDAVTGSVESIIYRGSTTRYVVDVGGEHLFVEQGVTDQNELAEGQQVELGWTPGDVLMFRPEGSRVRTN